MTTKLRISGLLSVGCLGLGLFTWNLLAADPQPAARKEVRAGDLHAKYPFVDIRSRLKYEASRANPPILSNEAEQRLGASETDLTKRLAVRPRLQDGWTKPEEKWDDETRARIRRYTLSMLHTHSEDTFINADGFGMERIGPNLRTRYLDLPTPGSLPFAKVERPQRAAQATVSTPEGVDDENPLRIPSRARLAEWHAQGELGFLNLGGLGIKPREVRWGKGDKEDLRVAGFESHRFRSIPVFVDHGPLALTQPVENSQAETPKVHQPAPAQVDPQAEDHERWLIERLELVSLLKHDTPAVYVSKELPAMEALAKTPVRQPSAFETEAVAKLRAGEDLIVESRAHELRMVGSIRARQQCLDCHQTQRGALLGAFSYDLAREVKGAR